LNDIQKEKVKTIIQSLRKEIECDVFNELDDTTVQTIEEAIEILTELSADPDYTGCYD